MAVYFLAPYLTVVLIKGLHFFHVVIGPFTSKDEANNIANLIKAKIKISIFVVTKEKN